MLPWPSIYELTNALSAALDKSGEGLGLGRRARPRSCWCR